MCVITAYGVQCLVPGCRGSGAGQQGVRPETGMLHNCVTLHLVGCILESFTMHGPLNVKFNPYPTAFPYGNGMVLHF